MAACLNRFVQTRRHLCAFMLSLAPGQTRPKGQALPSGAVRAGLTLTRHQVNRRVLASSIDLDIKLQTVAFGQLAHTRTLNSADMHESIGLAIITGDEAKALHGVEELDRTGGLVARQLTLGSSRRFALGSSDHVTHDRQIAGRHLAAAIHEREFQALTFGKAFETGAFNSADVDEHVFATIFTLDKAETLLGVEELDHALALANHLGRHAATTGSAAAEAATTGSAAAEAAAIAAAEAATVTTAEATAVTTAEATTATAAKTIATAETVTTAHERVETFFAEPVALVSAPAATSSIETHKTERTFASP
jgi:hypothetical protein